MRVAVFREARKGTGPRDFAHAAEGEVLTLPAMCSSAERRDACGCGRAFVGVDTGLHCTVAVVEERDEDAVMEAFRSSRWVVAWAELGPEATEDVETEFRSLCALLPAPGRSVRIQSDEDKFELYGFDPCRVVRERRPA